MRTPLTTSLLALAITSAAAIAPVTAIAADEHNTVPGLTAAGAPLGLHGIDPVAFVDLENRIDGSAMHTAVHDGVAYYFDSAENARRFQRSPERYVPQNGGFCTFGVSVGKKFDGNPRYADIVDGRLYVFLNAEIFAMYKQDRAGTIAKAERQWQRIRSVSATEL